MAEKQKAEIKDNVVIFGHETILDGKKIKQVTFRRPKTKDIRMAEQCADGYEQTNQLVRVLTGIDAATDTEFDEMDYEDYANLSTVALGFLKR